MEDYITSNPIQCMKLIALTSAALMLTALAAPAAVTITFDENGNGDNNGTALAHKANFTDPLNPIAVGPLLYEVEKWPARGQTPVLGDVLVDAYHSTTVRDLIRFEEVPITDSKGKVTDWLCMIVYSHTKGVEAHVDANHWVGYGANPGFQANLLTVQENAAGTLATWTPSSTQPGYLGPNTTYDFTPAPVSPVPEPTTLIAGMGALGIFFATVLRAKARGSLGSAR